MLRRFASLSLYSLYALSGLGALGPASAAFAQGPPGGFSYVRQLPQDPDPTIRPGATEGARNLEALGRLLAVVRFFHPSDEGARCDWNGFAVAAIPRVEPASGPRDLAARLRAVFAPVAPAVRIWAGGEPAPLAPAALLPPNGDDSKLRRVEWWHSGVKLDLEPDEASKKSTPQSLRIDDRMDLGWGNLAQSIPAGKLRGRKVRLSAAVDAEVGPAARVQLWLRVDRLGGRRGFFDNSADRPLREPGWRTVEITGTVDADAEAIAFGLSFQSGGSEGRARFDDVRLETVDGGEPFQAKLANADFSQGEARRQPPGWTFPYESVRAGYRLGLLIGAPCRNGGCAELEAGKIAHPPFPAPAQTAGIDLPGGVHAEVPTTLYADARGTLPHSGERAACVSPAAAGEGATPEQRARSERLAALLLAWGAIDLFRPYTPADGAPADWSESLRENLPEAMAAPDDRSFLHPFRRMLFDLADDNAQVTRADLEPTHRLPIEWRFVDWRRIYVTGVAPGVTAVKVGDLVGSVDGPLVYRHPILQGREESAATAEARRRKASLHYLFGEDGSEAHLTVQSPGGSVREVTLKRSLPAEAAVAPPRPGPIAEPAPGVFYLDLERIGDPEFTAALLHLESAQALIFDLRGRPSVSRALIAHLVDRATLGPRLKLPFRLLPNAPPYDWLETFWEVHPAAPYLAARCAFLIDERARGYSETLLSIVEHEKRCELVGSRTAGLNGTVNQMLLPRGFQLSFTTLKVEKPDGTPLYGVGIEPTVPVEVTPEGIAAGRDEVLEAALAAVRR